MYRCLIILQMIIKFQTEDRNGPNWVETMVPSVRGAPHTFYSFLVFRSLPHLRVYKGFTKGVTGSHICRGLIGIAGSASVK